MMDVMPPVASGTPLIERYGGRSFLVSGKEYQNSIIIDNGEVRKWDINPDIDGIDEDSVLSALKEISSADILIIGTGKSQIFLSPNVSQQAKEQNIAMDFMDTGAACRTYNILVTEDRNVSAILKIV